MSTTTPDTTATSHSRRATTRSSGSVAVWSVLALATLVLVALVVFIAQNSQSVEIRYVGANTSVGFGVALLLAAVAGAVITALVAAVLRIRRSLRSRG